uniref:Uncharacterized protein n=1 Tax=Junco hyemalis TaxID=40217 RepID=A0A8C5JE18_JUNHY
MTLFDGVYPFYPQHRKAAVFDISTIIVTVVFLTLACCFLLIIPGIRGRAVTSFFLAVVQFTGDWERGWVQANTSYKSFTLHMHLLSVGIRDHSCLLLLLLQCSWSPECSQHMEILTQSTLTHGTLTTRLWSPPASRVAFCTWIISNILLSMPALVYGGYMLLATGAFMIFSLLSFSTVRNSPMCPIQIGSSTLHVAYGGSFWLMLAVGESIGVPQEISLSPRAAPQSGKCSSPEPHKSQSPSELTEINSV